MPVTAKGERLWLTSCSVGTDQAPHWGQDSPHWQQGYKSVFPGPDVTCGGERAGLQRDKA